MGKQDQDSIQAFDALYTTNQIQILKILLPFCPSETRKSLVVMIRFLELQYALAFVRSNPECFRDPPIPFSLNEIYEKISSYCPPQLRSMLEQIRSMQNAMQMYEEMKQVMELFGGTDQDGEGKEGQDKEGQDAASPDEAFDPMSMLMGMLSPSQKEMFQMFQSEFKEN
ncbi:MAG TPA: hypothetical protein H9717_15825 [Candidatus Eisenbergiella merdipullorum]|uniref:Uncharacterized protein n=1 Tax=Candidatus Eisenbergiella merdipullorum TaxID=2838553 RepID=A0A9D2I900_9FIRM|nr:hypothetical protein [Candidatus Eisenbergiella merdipullorum]